MRTLSLLVGAVALAAISACSGTYLVGTDGAAAGNPGAGGNAGTPGSAGSLAQAGTPNGTNTYCGQPMPAVQSAELAPPLTVANRLQLFLLDNAGPTSNVPATITREWASTRALEMLDSLSVASAPGLDRFMRSYWPETPTAELWSSFFSSRRGTLPELFTSQVALEPGAGLLTDLSVLKAGSLCHRAAIIGAQALCMDIPLPPRNIEPLPTSLPPGATHRSLFETATNGSACQACHRVFDGLGFALGNFAQDGAYSTVENGLPIDSSGNVDLFSGETLTFADAKGLGAELGTSCQASLCIAQKLLADAQHVAFLHPIDTQEHVRIARDFEASGHDLRTLVKLVVESDAFLRKE